MRRIVEEGGVGICVDAGDPAELAKAATELEADPDRLELFRKASCQLAPKYSREIQAATMINVLEGVLPHSAARSARS